MAGNLYYEKVKRTSTDDDEDKQNKMRYISEGSWRSKMLVSYELKGETINDESHGGGSLIRLPDDATNIQVRFQVERFPGIWCDVKEYDRFKKCWVEMLRNSQSTSQSCLV